MKKTNKSPTPVTDSKDNKPDAPMNCVYASPEIFQKKTAPYPFNYTQQTEEIDSTDRHIMQDVYASPANIHGRQSVQMHSDDSSEDELKKRIEILIQQSSMIEEEHATTEIRLRKKKPEASQTAHRLAPDTVKFCAYCGEHNSYNAVCKNCGKLSDINIDPEATVAFCHSCRESIPLFSAFCPFCGKKSSLGSSYPFNHAVSLKDTTEIPSFCHVCGIVMASDTQFCPNCGTPQENKTTQNDDSSMGCVYAAPGRYSAPNKSGFLSKLFGRKK